MRYPISKIAAGVLSLVMLPALAADYYIVVPLKGQKSPSENISVSLGSVSLPSAMVGQPYAGFDLNAALSVIGDPSFNPGQVTWSVVGGALPSGLVLSNGVISGTPTAAGSNTFQVRATYKTKSGEQGYQVFVGSIQVGLDSASLPVAQVGAPYSFNLKSLLTVTGDAGYTGANVTWSLASGALPAGLTLNSSTGEVSGTPVSPGNESFQVRATYKSSSGAQTYQVVVGAINVGLASASLPQAQVGQAYNYDLKQLLTVTGDAGYNVGGVTWSVDSGSLPAGLALTGGAVSGTPTAPGSSTFQVRATYKSSSGEQTYQVVVVSISATLPDVGFGGVAAGTTADRTATLSNTGTGALSLTTPDAGSVTGAGFSFVGTTCGASLAPGASCATTIRYSASGISAASGSLGIGTAAGPKVAALSGQSQQAILGVTPTARAFGNVTMGQSAVGAAHTVTNTGNIAVQGLSIAPPAGYSLATNTCGTSLAANSSCQFAVSFAPTAAQAYNANVPVASSNAGTQNVSLTGTGVWPRFTAAQFTCSAIYVRNPITYVDTLYVSFTNKTGYTLTTQGGQTLNNGSPYSNGSNLSVGLVNGQTLSCNLSNQVSISG